MKIHIATDHAGFELKEYLLKELSKKHEVIDHGAYTYDKLDDYPKYCIDLAKEVVNTQNTLGIVIGGSGNGEQIASNKVKGIRAALCWNVETAELARKHNNANIISIGARMHSKIEALKIVEKFLNTEWTNEKRHLNRINQISDYEKTTK